MTTWLMRRPLALRAMVSSLPKLVRTYSQPATKQYDNLLVSTPKPGVGLSMPSHFYPSFLDALTRFNVLVLIQSQLIGLEL